MSVSMTTRPSAGKPNTNHRHRARIGRTALGLAAVAVVALPVGAADAGGEPSESGVVTRVEVPFGVTWFDVDEGLIALTGPPPEQGCVGDGFEGADWTIVWTPTGPAVLLAKDEAPVRIYAATSQSEVCEAALDGGIEPLYHGDEIKITLTDNYANFEPGDRSNPFGYRGHGLVYDADGNTYRFSAVVQAQIPREGLSPCGCALIRTTHINISPS